MSTSFAEDEPQAATHYSFGWQSVRPGTPRLIRPLGRVRERRGNGVYWRQLRDMKGSALVEAMAPFGLNFYAGICGWTLARAHARSGDPIAIAAYLGSSDKFDRSITDFCERYADQNEQDYRRSPKRSETES